MNIYFHSFHWKPKIAKKKCNFPFLQRMHWIVGEKKTIFQFEWFIGNDAPFIAMTHSPRVNTWKKCLLSIQKCIVHYATGDNKCRKYVRQFGIFFILLRNRLAFVMPYTKHTIDFRSLIFCFVQNKKTTKGNACRDRVARPGPARPIL